MPRPLPRDPKLEPPGCRVLLQAWALFILLPLGILTGLVAVAYGGGWTLAVVSGVLLVLCTAVFLPSLVRRKKRPREE